MEGYVATLTYLFAVGTVLLGLLVLMSVVTRLSTGVWLPASVEGTVRAWALRITAGFTVFGTLLSLFYSEVVGFTPCVLCWFARTMLFPLSVITLIAAWRNDTSVRPYVIVLSLVGMLITGYHHLYQMGFTSGTLCNALTGGGGCDKLYVLEFGFVTMPLMGFTLFAATALLAWLARRP